MRLLLTILLLLSTLCFGADCSRIIPFILTWEGGYAKLPHDPGGETNKGVTWTTWKHFYGNTHAEFLKMPTDKWGHIYKVGYWDVMHGDQIRSQRVAELLAEWCWLSGAPTPTKTVQRIVGVTADGIIGMGTIKAINGANEKIMYQQLFTARLRYISRIPYYSPTNWIFVDGWFNRMTALMFFQNDSVL